VQTTAGAEVAVIGGFQLLHLVLLVATSIKLAKQLAHRTATLDFLVQSYLSTILVYAGVYVSLLGTLRYHARCFNVDQ
jgi:predicted transporter